jgi:hypothetical protein
MHDAAAIGKHGHNQPTSDLLNDDRTHVAGLIVRFEKKEGVPMEAVKETADPPYP